MIKLFNETDYRNATSFKLLPLKCYFCKKTFYTEKRHIRYEINSGEGRLKYCSRICGGHKLSNKKIIVCTNCNAHFKRVPSQIKRSKNNFCSRSCAAIYNNKHKKFGTRRSKLEHWLETQLIGLYADLDICFNRKDTIESELDIYIPSLNVAFEINGIFHYEPIYGIDKLAKIKENDISKSKACHDAKIDLCTIDVSKETYFKEKNSQKYLDIIVDIIEERLLSIK